MTRERLSLLLVDDEDGIRVVMSVLLRDLGYDVATASRGDEALALYEQLLPEIVVSDIKMPGLDGIALLKAIKERNASAEVILLTGHGDMDLAVAGLQNGAGDFLNKPVSDAALTVALERACRRIAMREALRRHTEELEELVAQKTADLIRSERFAAVGESAASLAHAIKNIAGALEGTMFVLEKGLELNKREYFEQGWQMIRGDVSRLRTLAVGLLELGRQAELRFSPTLPAKPAQEVLDSLRHTASEAGIALELADLGGQDPFVMAEEAVHQCLLNLVLNSVEALSANAAAQSSEEKSPPAVKITVRRARLPNGGSAVSYAVTDNGPGMPDSLWEHGVFQSGKIGGSGIGLFSTRKLAHEMGATLSFTSSQGQGTEVLLQLHDNS